MKLIPVLIILLSALINIPFFPAPLNVGAFGFCVGMATCMTLERLIRRDI